jgi:hypothetical protein
MRISFSSSWQPFCRLKLGWISLRVGWVEVYHFWVPFRFDCGMPVRLSFPASFAFFENYSLKTRSCVTPAFKIFLYFLTFGPALLVFFSAWNSLCKLSCAAFLSFAYNNGSNSRIFVSIEFLKPSNRLCRLEVVSKLFQLFTHLVLYTH